VSLSDPALLEARPDGMPAERRDAERITRVLAEGEAVVCVAEGLFRSSGQGCGGHVVLTDRRLLCVDHRAETVATMEVRLDTVTSIVATVSDQSGAAQRGEISLIGDGEPTTVLRIEPAERAGEIASYVSAVNVGSSIPG
jgi:hypothetical protein